MVSVRSRCPSCHHRAVDGVGNSAEGRESAPGGRLSTPSTAGLGRGLQLAHTQLQEAVGPPAGPTHPLPFEAAAHHQVHLLLYGP